MAEKVHIKDWTKQTNKVSMFIVMSPNTTLGLTGVFMDNKEADK